MTAGYQAPLSVLPFPVTGRREALQKLRAILRKSAIPPCVPRTRRRNMLLRRAGTFVASVLAAGLLGTGFADRKSTRLNSSHVAISYAVFCLKKQKLRRHIFVEHI